MCNAAFTGQLHVLQRLRTADVDVNASDPAFGGTALMVAAGKGHRECVELLLACGAQKDAAARDGKTAFIVAALNGFVGCTKILAHCVRIPARLFGNSPSATNKPQTDEWTSDAAAGSQLAGAGRPEEERVGSCAGERARGGCGVPSAQRGAVDPDLRPKALLLLLLLLLLLRVPLLLLIHQLNN